MLSDACIVMGIDPGRNGGVALVRDAPRGIMATARLDEFMAEPSRWLVGASCIAIERPIAGPRTHVGALMQLTHQIGYITGLVCQRPVLQYTPARWQHAMLSGVPAVIDPELAPFVPASIKRSPSKQRALIRVRSEFEHETAKLMRRGVYHDGIVDAVLIAIYALTRLRLCGVTQGVCLDDKEIEI